MGLRRGVALFLAPSVLKLIFNQKKDFIMKKTIHFIVLTTLFWLVAQPLWATNYFYTGINLGNWGEPTNWSPIGVPSLGDGANISGKGVTLSSGGATIHTLTITNGGSVNGVSPLTVTGNAVITGGIALEATVSIEGNLTLNAADVGNQYIGGKTALLTWTTASEQDASHFEIERSSDGKTFDKIGEIKAKGTANTYNLTDADPLSKITYFRLKMVNNDGTFSYSKIISLSMDNDLIVKAFPNPMANELTIETVSNAKHVQIDVIDILGRRIFHQNTEGSNSLTIKTLDWQSGVYILTVKDDKNELQQKIIKR
jgi:hypothetical protein